MIFLALLLQTADPAAKADAFIREQMAARKIPGMSVAVVQDGKLVFERAYGLDHLPTEDEMTALAERWRPYRSLAVGYLFASEFEEAT